MLVALVGLALVYLWSRLRRWPAGVHLAKSAWIIALVVTPGMYLLGKFPTYYGWMLAVPVAVVLATLVDQAPPPAGRWGSRFVVLIAVLAGGVGLPMQIFIASHDWQERNPAAINAWLGPKIKPGDVVFCDYPFYYTAKERARQVYVGRYMRLLTPEDLNRITLVVVSGKPNPSDWKIPGMLKRESLVGSWVPARGGLFGNRWASGFLSAPNYRCEVYRLKEPGTPSGIEMGGLEQGQK
jgi:hypothetical protein